MSECTGDKCLFYENICPPDELCPLRDLEQHDADCDPFGGLGEDIDAIFDSMPHADLEAHIADIQHRAENYRPGIMPDTAGNY